MVKFISAASILLTSLTSAQVYLHSPRGSNNRLNEQTANNANPYRLFFANHNSENNRRGGYNVGENSDNEMDNENDQYHMKYFMSGEEAPSWLTVEWTQLLGCGTDEDGDRVHNCEIVIQAMCQEDKHPESITNERDSIKEVENAYTIKNGEKTSTIKYSEPRKGRTESRRDKLKRRDRGSNAEDYGLHESWESYERCPDYLEKDDRKRAGFECPHERENYPVNYGTQWTDIAYFTDNLKNCNAIQLATRKPKYECVEYYDSRKNYRKHKSSHTSEKACNDNDGDWLPFYQFKEYETSITSEKACRGKDLVWGRALDYEAIADDKLTRPRCLRLPVKAKCLKTPSTRQNYLGMADNTNEAPRFQWALPIYEKDQRCVMRIRHIISNNDEDSVDGDNKDIRTVEEGSPNRSVRSASSPSSSSSSSSTASSSSSSTRSSTPSSSTGSSSSGSGSSTEDNSRSLHLALPQRHSSQNKVVYQDRSHIFKLLTRPSQIPQDQTLHNIVIRGKRGNIVQTYPAVEYDFCPNNLKIENGDAIQFQWTGSNTHNNQGESDGQAGDAGEGQGGTDRSNMIQLYYNKVNFPSPSEMHTMFENAEFLWSSKNGGTSRITPQEAALAHATSGYYWSARDVEDTREELNSQLNNASPSFQGVVFKPQSDQKYFYVSMRNNNFSNRSQKGKIIVGNPVDDDAEIRASLRKPKWDGQCSLEDKDEENRILKSKVETLMKELDMLRSRDEL